MNAPGVYDSGDPVPLAVPPAVADFLAASFGLIGQVALVTGSSGGIGYGLARGLARAGARVVVNGRDASRTAAAAAMLRGEGLDARAEVFDVTVEGEVRSAFDRIESSAGPVSVLVNNAGIQHRQPLLKVELADWERVVQTNLTASFLVAREAARRWTACGLPGKVIAVSSLASLVARVDVGPYAAAKGGVKMMTQAMAAEWSGRGIQVNALAPGHILTEMTRAKSEDPEFDSWVRGRTPAGRWGVPDDLVGAAVFLASAASSYVSGITLVVDGGTMAVL